MVVEKRALLKKNPNWGHCIPVHSKGLDIKDKLVKDKYGGLYGLQSAFYHDQQV